MRLMIDEINESFDVFEYVSYVYFGLMCSSYQKLGDL